MRPAIIVVILFLSAPNAWALSPPALPELAQDDAGSGRDAGGTADDAVPVAPETLYHGNLTTPLGPGPFLRGDDTDAYLFDVPASVLFRVMVWTEGALCVRVHDGVGTEVAERCASPALPQSLEASLDAGRYTLVATYFDPAPYRFAFTLDGSEPPADPNAPDPVGALEDLVLAEPAPLAGATPASQEAQHVVVAVVDTGINPYHDAFAAPALRGHPSTWLPGFPADARALDLTLDEPDLATARAADDAVWREIERAPEEWRGGAGVPLYTFPGTRVVGAVSFGEYVDTAGGQIGVPANARAIWDDMGHGTHSAGLAAGANISGPDGDVLVVMVEVAGGDGFLYGALWAAEQPWIDVISVSSGAPGNHPLDVATRMAGGLDMGEVARRAVESGKIFFASSGNGIDPAMDTPERCVTYTSVAKGSEWLVRIGAAMPRSGNPGWWHCVPADAVARTSVPAPDTLSTDGMSEATGTSASSPNAAGHFAQLALRVKESGIALGQRGILQHLLNASEYAEPAVEVYAAPSIRPLSPIVEGYGVIDAGAVERAYADILAGVGPRPRPDMDAWVALDHEVRHRLYHEEEGVFRTEPLVEDDDGGSGGDASFSRVVDVEPGRTHYGVGRGMLLDPEDVYAFDAQAGDRLRFHQLSASCWNLRSPSGEEISLGCTSAGENVKLSGTGRHLLIVTNTAPEQYWFSFTLDGSDPPPANPTPVSHPAWVEALQARQDDAGTGWDAPAELDAAFWIEPETVVHGMTDVWLTDAEDAYRFHAEAGDALQVRLRAPVGNVVVYGPDQEAVTSVVVAGGIETVIDLAVGSTGTWYVSWKMPSGVDYAFAVGLDGTAPEVERWGT